MNQTKLLAPIGLVLVGDREVIISDWVSDIGALWLVQYPNLVRADELLVQTRAMLDALIALFAAHDGDGPPEISEHSVLALLAIELSSSRALLGFKPADTAQYVISLKKVLTRRVIKLLQAQPITLVACLSALDEVIDRISLLTFNAYVTVRERVIAQQSLSLLELSSPAVRLWDQVILLPLIGVIDSVRARQFSEGLLEAIVRFEASVAIIDVTGVPVFDSGVARHIMQAVEAAQLLGARIVMTGLNPEGAQTLTKLGISFASIISRASLRAGLAEALKISGHRIVPILNAV
jgi:rsbT co-antagonist protein RsbR